MKTVTEQANSFIYKKATIGVSHAETEKIVDEVCKEIEWQNAHIAALKEVIENKKKQIDVAREKIETLKSKLPELTNNKPFRTLYHNVHFRKNEKFIYDKQKISAEFKRYTAKRIDAETAEKLANAGAEIEWEIDRLKIKEIVKSTGEVPEGVDIIENVSIIIR